LEAVASRRETVSGLREVHSPPLNWTSKTLCIWILLDGCCIVLLLLFL
jgi:hypothetical protein